MSGKVKENELLKEVLVHLKQELFILQREANNYVLGSYQHRHYQLRSKSNKILTGKVEEYLK